MQHLMMPHHPWGAEHSALHCSSLWNCSRAASSAAVLWAVKLHSYPSINNNKLPPHFHPTSATPAKHLSKYTEICKASKRKIPPLLEKNVSFILG